MIKVATGVGYNLNRRHFPESRSNTAALASNGQLWQHNPLAGHVTRWPGKNPLEPNARGRQSW